MLTTVVRFYRAATLPANIILFGGMTMAIKIIFGGFLVLHGFVHLLYFGQSARQNESSML